MSREFVEMTTPAERASILNVLFTVANADGKVSKEERKEIHNIADYLLLSDNLVAEAHSKIAD
jgi:tellurite resistance protein